MGNVWMRKYHLEVEIRTEIKKVLDNTLVQLTKQREGAALFTSNPFPCALIRGKSRN